MTAGIDPAQPSAAPIYDYLLGGMDNYAVDRAAADRVLAVAPDQRSLARANRAFAIRAVRALAAGGPTRSPPAPAFGSPAASAACPGPE